MAKYKVTKVYIVEASNKVEAVDKVTKDPGELLEYVSAKKVENPGFLGQVKQQLIGK